MDPVEMPATTAGAGRSAARWAWMTPALKKAPAGPEVKQMASRSAAEFGYAWYVGI